jgi:hypothetical protein
MNERTAIVALLDGANFTHLQSSRLLLSLAAYYLERRLRFPSGPRRDDYPNRTRLADAMDKVMSAIEDIEAMES